MIIVFFYKNIFVSINKIFLHAMLILFFVNKFFCSSSNRLHEENSQKDWIFPNPGLGSFLSRNIIYNNGTNKMFKNIKENRIEAPGLFHLNSSYAAIESKLYSENKQANESNVVANLESKSLHQKTFSLLNIISALPHCDYSHNYLPNHSLKRINYSNMQANCFAPELEKKNLLIETAPRLDQSCQTEEVEKTKELEELKKKLTEEVEKIKELEEFKKKQEELARQEELALQEAREEKEELKKKLTEEVGKIKELEEFKKKQEELASQKELEFQEAREEKEELKKRLTEEEKKHQELEMKHQKEKNSRYQGVLEESEQSKALPINFFIKNLPAEEITQLKEQIAQNQKNRSVDEDSSSKAISFWAKFREKIMGFKKHFALTKNVDQHFPLLANMQKYFCEDPVLILDCRDSMLSIAKKSIAMKWNTLTFLGKASFSVAGIGGILGTGYVFLNAQSFLKFLSKSKELIPYIKDFCTTDLGKTIGAGGLVCAGSKFVRGIYQPNICHNCKSPCNRNVTHCQTCENQPQKEQ